ncbi:hypothetical protein M8818_000603 [Zalaria obscura]|uniref:Uncharacterized protein n=1 Tax=Zalaria obscura TaxID=2024903 RepID=A0ACC3SPY6_9PEZI
MTFLTSPLLPPDTYTNTTAVDNIFGWGEQYGVSPPVFGKYPLEYNTIVNASSAIWGRHAIYLLLLGTTSEYALCSIQARQTPHCSTRYNASSSGATLEAMCEQHDDEMQYLRSLKNASSGASTLSPDWFNIAGEWANSLSLGAGISDGNASNARLLSQFILAEPELSAELPSTAEALAVLAGSTLLMSTQDTPLVEFWNYTAKNSYMTVGQYQYFNATIRAQQYASGAKSGYQNGFYVVLVAVFAINIIVLVYFLKSQRPRNRLQRASESVQSGRQQPAQ